MIYLEKKRVKRSTEIVRALCINKIASEEQNAQNISPNSSQE